MKTYREDLLNTHFLKQALGGVDDGLKVLGYDRPPSKKDGHFSIFQGRIINCHISALQNKL